MKIIKLSLPGNKNKKIKFKSEYADYVKFMSVIAELSKAKEENLKLTFKDIENEVIELQDSIDLEYFLEQAKEIYSAELNIEIVKSPKIDSTGFISLNSEDKISQAIEEMEELKKIKADFKNIEEGQIVKEIPVVFVDQESEEKKEVAMPRVTPVKVVVKKRKNDGKRYFKKLIKKRIKKVTRMSRLRKIKKKICHKLRKTQQSLNKSL